MANLRDIRNRIKSVKNTAQITRAMQLVAASKMKRAQDLALAGRNYSSRLASILAVLVDKVGEYNHPFLTSREVKKRGVILVSTEKGLCGPLNTNLFRLVTEELPKETTEFVALGRKGSQFLARTARKLKADFSVSDNSRFSEVRPAVDLLVKAYLDGEVDTIEVAYSRFKNTLIQEATIAPVLPLTKLREALIAESAGAPVEDLREMKFEPDPATLLDALLELYLKNRVYQLVLEAKASEHSARMVAMKAATDNAKKLVSELTLEYNKARQAAITQEILEISAANVA